MTFEKVYRYRAAMYISDRRLCRKNTKYLPFTCNSRKFSTNRTKPILILSNDMDFRKALDTLEEPVWKNKTTDSLGAPFEN